MRSKRRNWRRVVGWLAVVTLAVIAVPRGARATTPYMLADYAEARFVTSLPNMSADASGVAYNPITGTVFVIRNGDEAILEYDLAGSFIREIELDNFEDTEGIVYMEDTWYGTYIFGVVEEGRGTIAVIEIDDTVEYIDRDDTDLVTIVTPSIDLNPTGLNKGLEGIAWDEVNSLFYVVKEDNDEGTWNGPTVFEVETDGTATRLFDPTVNHGGGALTSHVTDLADIFFADGDLFLLSQESEKLVTVSLSGVILETRTTGITEFTQPEGLCFTSGGREMLVVGESAEYKQFGLPAEIVGRHVFYNNSIWDDPNESRDDDDAIAPGVEAMFPGESPEFANWTSYSKGLNGLMIDVKFLPTAADDLSTSDFEFRAGKSYTTPLPAVLDVDNWSAPGGTIEITVRRGEGVDGSDRVTIIFEDGEIFQEYLYTRFLGPSEPAEGYIDPMTGLEETDVFYFGNLPGETGLGGDNQGFVDTTDRTVIQTSYSSSVDIDSQLDMDRDGDVDVDDRDVAYNNPVVGFGNIPWNANTSAPSE